MSQLALGWTALLQGDLQAAREAFDRAMALDRNFAETHGAIAVVHARQGLRDEAIAAIERAVRLDKHCASAQYARAVLDGSAADPQAMRGLAKRVLTERMAAPRR